MADFERFLDEANQVVARVQGLQAQLVRYRSRLVKPYVLCVSSLIGTVLFGLGVFIPMVDPGASIVVAAWVPGLVYMTLLFSVTGWLAARIYRRGNAWR